MAGFPDEEIRRRLRAEMREVLENERKRHENERRRRNPSEVYEGLRREFRELIRESRRHMQGLEGLFSRVEGGRGGRLRRLLPLTDAREAPLFYTLNVVVLPLEHGRDHIEFQGLEAIVESSVNLDNTMLNVYSYNPLERNDSFFQHLADIVRAEAERYPVELEPTAPIPREKKWLYLGAMSMPLIPTSVPVIGGPISYMRKGLSIAGGVLGLLIATPKHPVSAFGFMLFGAAIGYLLPTILGITGLSYEVLSRKLDRERKLLIKRKNERVRRRIEEFSDLIRYQELPSRFIVPAELAEDEINNYLNGSYAEPARPLTNPVIYEAMTRFINNKHVFSQLPYVVQRYYRNKRRSFTHPQRYRAR